MAQRLDTNSSQVIGAPFRVVEPVLWDWNTNRAGAAGFSVSDNGVLAYRAWIANDLQELAWVDRSGKREGRVGVPGRYENPRLSPDGQRLAVFKPESGGDVWVTVVETGISTRFTEDPASDNVPLWSPDGTRIAFVSNRDGGVFNIYQKNAGGTGPEELLLKTEYSKMLNDWSRDGRYILYQEDNPQTKTDVLMLSLSDRKVVPLLNTSSNESEATLSPDGRWMAYTSDESGTRQVYVQKFPTPDVKRQVSAGAAVAARPRWGSDGMELFFDTTGTMRAVRVTGLESGGEFRSSVPTRLFNGLTSTSLHNFDVTDAGQRFLVLLNLGAVTGEAAPITVVVNWKSGLSLGR
jgi:eukaryotic-like serine/threonine-protein kinase